MDLTTSISPQVPAEKGREAPPTSTLLDRHVRQEDELRQSNSTTAVELEPPPEALPCFAPTAEKDELGALEIDSRPLSEAMSPDLGGEAGLAAALQLDAGELQPPPAQRAALEEANDSAGKSPRPKNVSRTPKLRPARGMTRPAKLPANRVSINLKPKASTRKGTPIDTETIWQHLESRFPRKAKELLISCQSDWRNIPAPRLYDLAEELNMFT